MKYSIAVLQAELKKFEDAADKIRDLIRFLGGETAQTKPASAVINPQIAAALDAVEKLLTDEGPLPRAAIWSRLPQGHGIKDEKTLGNYMARDIRFDGIGKGPGAKWGLTGQPQASGATKEVSA